LGGKPQELITEDKHRRLLIPFPAEPGVTWSQVSIRFLSSIAVALTAGNARRGNQYTEIGFEDLKTKKYILGWFVLAAFGYFNGTLKENYDGLLYKLKSRPRLAKQIQSLNNLLDSIFEIEGKGRAIVFDRKKHYYRGNIGVSLAEDEIFDEIKDSFKTATLPKGTPEDLREMKFQRKS
jgi:hypothetical protein